MWPSSWPFKNIGCPRDTEHDNEVTLIPTQPLQDQQGDREEAMPDIAVEREGFKTKSAQDLSRHDDLRSDLRGEEFRQLNSILDTAAFNPAPETQIKRPGVIEASFQEQMEWTQGTANSMLQDTKIQDLQDEIPQLETKLEEYQHKKTQPRTEITQVRKRDDEYQLRLQLEEYQRENTQLKTDIAQDRKRDDENQLRTQLEFSKLRLQLEEYQRENTQLITDIAQVRKRAEAAEQKQANEYQSHRRSSSELQAHIGKLNSQIGDLRALVMSRDKAITNSHKVSDDAIKASWLTMAYNIQSLVATNLTGHASRQDLSHHGHENKEESCAFCEINATQVLLLNDEEMRECVIEKIVWDAVTRRVLFRDAAGFGKSWAGVPGQLLSALFEKLLDVPEMRENPAKLFRWKAESAAMIDNVLGVDNEELDIAVEEEYRGLRSFIPRDHPDIGAARHRLYQELRNIFKEAVEIRRILMQSRAYFYLDQVDTEGTARYNPEFHEAEAWVEELSDNSVVQLAISPSLVKIGNADGGNYDKCNRLVKASVICN